MAAIAFRLLILMNSLSEGRIVFGLQIVVANQIQHIKEDRKSQRVFLDLEGGRSRRRF
jgi:hypothetical protein